MALATTRFESHIENLWHELKLEFAREVQKNIDKLKRLCMEEWASIAPECCSKLVQEYNKRLKQVIPQKGHATVTRLSL